MKKKIVTLMLATALTASALTACGSSSDSSTSSSASASSAAVESSDSSVVETASSSGIADISNISDSTATENISEESIPASSESSEDSVAFTPIGDSLAIDFDLNGDVYKRQIQHRRLTLVVSATNDGQAVCRRFQFHCFDSLDIFNFKLIDFH